MFSYGKLPENMKEIKIAIIHDALLENGGSEQVLSALCEAFPKADLFTSLVRENSLIYQKYKKRLKSYLLFPFPSKVASWCKPFVILYWWSLNLSAYHLILSSSHSYSAKSVRIPQKAKHICYCHTPPRYLYSQETEYDLSHLWQIVIRPFVCLMRVQDYLAAQRVDLFIANSATVKKRILKYYLRNAKIIFPPVDIPKSSSKRPKTSNYYLYVGRLTKTKGLELIIKACITTHRKLYIIGDGSYKQKLLNFASPQIEFLGYVSEKKKKKYIKGAKAILFASLNEDFGIVPVEAIGLGTPVIAYRASGVAETIKHGRTGLFFEEYSNDAMVRTIHQFEKLHFRSDYLHQEALKYSKVSFIKKIKAVVNKIG